MQERKKKIERLVSEVIKDSRKSEKLKSLPSLKKDETIFEYQVQNLDKEKTLSIQTDESLINFKETEYHKTALKTEVETQRSQEVSTVFQNKVEEEKTQTFVKDQIQSPSEGELSLFTNNMSRMRKSICRTSREEELKVLLEIKDKDLQSKERSLMKYKIEIDRLRKELKWIHQKIHFLSHSLQEVFQKQKNEGEEDTQSLKKCMGEM